MLIEPQSLTDLPIPGFYYASAQRYHRDPAAIPSLSNSICQILVAQSPLHAWTAHPRLNPDWLPGTPSDIQEAGSAIHRQVLGRGQDLAILPFDNYKKKDAQAARDECRAAHMIPVLERKLTTIDRIANGLRNRVEQWLDRPISECLTEVIALAVIDGVHYRIMIDAITSDLSRWCDVKSTGMSCASDVVSRHLYSEGYHYQERFYNRVLDHLDPANMGRRQCAFLFGETKPPYATSRPQIISPAGQELARQTVERGVRLWKQCMATNHWPGYGTTADYAEPPSYLLMQMTNDLETEEGLHTEENSDA